jgi:4-hydroxy-3-methylbut-2-enyl diphosphate reductase
MSDLRVLAPMRIEARAARAGAPWARVERIGIGPRRARRVACTSARPALLVGFCGALDAGIEPGDVVLASELRGAARTLPCPDPTILAGVLRRGGLRVHVGPLVSSERIVAGKGRQELAQTGALAVDMESAWLAETAVASPLVVLRVALDTPHHEVHRPLRVAQASLRAYRSLRTACGLIDDWAQTLISREVILAAPRASCAGVLRAIEIVERALEQYGPPIFVRKQIVHNAIVVKRLEADGAVFVDELDEVPAGATVVFSAHGVSPAVRAAAAARQLAVIDATCPLVAKVHAEARRYAAEGFEIVLVGHEGHEEVEGTVGEAPERTRVIASIEEARMIDVEDPARVAVLTQTTLAVDETGAVVDTLRERFPDLRVPPSADICYATQNRQDAVRALAADCELVLVIGSQNSSNSRRLVEVARRAGARAELIERGEEIDPAMLIGVNSVGITAGASAPESLVQDAIRALAGLGAVRVSERVVAEEEVQFKLPKPLRVGC